MFLTSLRNYILLTSIISHRHRKPKVTNRRLLYTGCQALHLSCAGRGR